MASDIPASTLTLPEDLSRLSALIDDKPETFAFGDEDIRAAALQAAKFIFDLTLQSETHARPFIKELLEGLNEAERPQTRAQAKAAASAARPSSPQISEAILKPTPLPSLYVEDMDEDQIWAQLELKSNAVCETLQNVFDSSNMDPLPEGEESDMGAEGMDDDGVVDDDDSELTDPDDIEGLEGMDWDGGEVDSELTASEGEGGEDELGEEIAELRDPSEEDEDDDDDFDDLAEPTSRKSSLKKSKMKGHSELDDGFFKLADFNAQVEEMESRRVSRGKLGDDSDDSDAENEDPIDLFAPVDNNEAFDEEDAENANSELYYNDFFDPPKPTVKVKKGKYGKKRPAEPDAPRASKVRFHEEVKVKNIKSQGKGLPFKASMIDFLNGFRNEEDEDEDGEGNESGDLSMELDGEGEDEDEDDGEESSDGLEDGHEAVERLKNDLFAEEETPSTGLSTHEARMEDLRKQIADLEQENVGEKDWVLKGEVGSRGRPKDGLLEQDLDFDRIAKPVPVVTDEVIQDLESRIKARIIEGRFDDVVRKRPVDDKPFLPSRVFELQDSKSKESLAQIYERDYMAAQANGTPLDDRDGKLKKEHDVIEKLWEGICYKLDALCNAHFTPKQPSATISTVTNAAAITLESALPTAKSTTTILAPEEVFAAGSSEPRARSEMTPTEKQTERRRSRKQKMHQRQLLDKSVDKYAKMKGARGAKSVRQQKDAALKSVVKSGKGVTIIGKKSQTVERSKKKGKS